MRKTWIALAVALAVGLSPQASLAASGQKYTPVITYIGVSQAEDGQWGWVVRGLGVNSSYGVVIQVSYGYADGTGPVVYGPATSKFASGAGNAQWSAMTYYTPSPTNATSVAVDVTLINLKKASVPLDVQHAEATLGPDFIGNLYCDPTWYPVCPH